MKRSVQVVLYNLSMLPWINKSYFTLNKSYLFYSIALNRSKEVNHSKHGVDNLDVCY